MEENEKKINIRWLYLAFGTIAMLFAGIIYAWSILKGPLAIEFGWKTTQLAVNFTLTMCMFCLGSLIGALISKKIGVKLSVVIAGVLAGAGFVLTSLIYSNSIVLLYLTYGVIAGIGIGISYNVCIFVINSWFPDKKGLCTGVLMMGFGASALLLGSFTEELFIKVGWRSTYLYLGIAIAVVICVTGAILKLPGQDVVLPEPKSAKKVVEEGCDKEYTPKQMLARGSFWKAFLILVFISAVGSSVISFAKDIALGVGAKEKVATTIVGVFSIFNGLGRIITGLSYDHLGRRKTMLFANGMTIFATALILMSVLVTNLVLCVIGLCLVGISYGFCSTTTSVFPALFYGRKYFSSNMAYMLFHLVGGSLFATLTNTLLSVTNGYVVPFIMLLGLTIIAMVLNIFLRRP